ncbi:MAG TPA: hypothetical protein VIH20_03385 [Candidatus Subteraquimicrobiales bacterium]
MGYWLLDAGEKRVENIPHIPENIAPSAGVLDELRKNLEEIASLGDADAGREDDKKNG